MSYIPPTNPPLVDGQMVYGSIVERTLGEYIKAIQDKVPEDEPSVSMHPHYFKDVSHLKKLDVYRLIDLFEVENPCIQHAIKKLLVAGGRGHKDITRDIQDVIDTLLRWQEMQSEDKEGL